MSTLDILGFVVGSVDGAAGVSAAYQALEASPNSIPLRDAYRAAVANAIASETAVIPEEGAIFAANAIGEDVVSIADGGANNNLSAWLSLAGNVLTLAAQGAALTGAAEIVIPVGAAVFTIDQVASFVGRCCINRI